MGIKQKDFSFVNSAIANSIVDHTYIFREIKLPDPKGLLKNHPDYLLGFMNT